MSIDWNSLSEEQKSAFTMDNTVEKFDYWCGDEFSSAPIFWDSGEINNLISLAKNKGQNYYGITDTWLYECLDSNSIEGQKVAILGSQTPWYEAICLSYGALPTTIEYNKIETNDSRITTMTVDEYNKEPVSFDFAISVSSFEHDGLGRYGDPIDPDGDLKAMLNVKNNVLNVGGLLFLSVPVGNDAVAWNAHRKYGKIRLPKLIDGFDLIYSAGFSSDLFESDSGRGAAFQPVFVLRNI
jgi:hypothetical protein